jgi:glutaredoxin 3
MKIKIYSTNSCPYCKMAEDFLKDNKVKFEKINVENDQNALKEMIKKSGQTGVPVLDINGTIVIGFDVEGIRKALKLKA